MQLTLILEFSPLPLVKSILPNNPWIDVSPEARMIGFTEKVEISQSLSDTLQPFQTEDEDVYNQRLYDSLWLAHHYFWLDPCSSFSFTFDFLREDQGMGKIAEASLRLHAEMHEGTGLLGLLEDF